MKRISVWFYISCSSREPVKGWLKKLDANNRRIIGEDIKTVEIGWPLGMPLVRKMDKNLWEVRSDISDGRIARVLFTVQGKMMVLLHGFIKKSKSTPKSDFDLAKNRRNDVLKQR